MDLIRGENGAMRTKCAVVIRVAVGADNGRRFGILGNHGASMGYELRGHSSYLDRLWSRKHRTFRSMRLPKFHFRSRWWIDWQYYPSPSFYCRLATIQHVFSQLSSRDFQAYKCVWLKGLKPACIKRGTFNLLSVRDWRIRSQHPWNERDA
jgi:hypothetical protein